MKAYHTYLPRTAGLLAGALLALAGAYAAEADALPKFTDNYLKVSAAGPTSLTGSKEAFQARTQNSRTGAAGIEDFNLTKELDKATVLTIDGHALPGAEDYLAAFKVTKEEVGSFELGYKRFRTFYDGMGGFFPLNNAWIPLYERRLFVDRGKLYFNGTIALPNAPVFTFKYSKQTRTGRKDSTIWGDTDFTGVPIYSQSSLNLYSANRKIVPAYINLDERRDSWEAAVRHTMGNTTASLSVAGERINNANYRTVDRYPGELKPYPAIPSTPVTIIPPALANNPNKGLDKQNFKETALTFSGRIETVVSDMVKLYAAASYRNASGDISASRLIKGYLQTPIGVISDVGLFTSGGRPPYSYNSTGEINNKVTTAVAGLEFKPVKDLFINAAVKFEENKANGISYASYVNTLIVQATGVTTPVPRDTVNVSKINDKPVMPSVDFHYTGIPNVTLFGTFDYRRAPADEIKNYGGISPSGTNILGTQSLFYDNVTERHLYYRAGASWKVSSALTVRAEGYMKDHENTFEGYGSSLGGYYIYDYDTKGGRITVTARVSPELTFTTRYVYQVGSGNVAADGYREGPSNDSRYHDFAETIDWTPNKNVYVQANVNVVYSTVITAYGKTTGNAADVLHNSDNNYVQGSVLTGFVLTKETDALLQATYYRADNFNPAIIVTDPLGAGVRDYSVTAGVKHKLSDRMVASVKVGYFNSDSEMTGGNASYKGLAGYFAIEYSL